MTPPSRPHWPSPLNREAAFAPWAPFDPGRFVEMNPSVVRLGPDHAWVVFCRYGVPPEPGKGSVWAVRIDREGRPKGAPTMLLNQGIDPRVISLGGRLLVFFCLIEWTDGGALAGSSMALAEFTIAREQWVCRAVYPLPKTPVAGPAPVESDPRWEKNWVPFALGDDRVGLIYAHEPWTVVVLQLPPEGGAGLTQAFIGPAVAWDYGTARGGTPPIRFDDDHLVTFFHSSQVLGSRRVYHVGACVFSAHEPYTPVSMTQRPLLTAPYRSGVHRFGWPFAISVVFPLGAETTEGGTRLYCGLDDGEVATFTVPHDMLASRLEPIRPFASGTLHSYRTPDAGARLPLTRLLYVPDSVGGIPDLPMIDFIRVLAGQGRTFVDVGAKIGAYTMGLAPGFARVIAFETSRPNFDWLCRNRTLNDYRHVVCEPAVLGETAGEAVERLDDRGLRDVDLLKIDAEDREVPVLRGARETVAASRPVILLDVATEAEPRESLKAAMDAMAYTFEPIFPRSPRHVLCLPNERRAAFAWFV